MQKNAFVTGGTGFLGTPLLQNLSAQGWNVLVMHRKNSDLKDIKGLKGVQFVVGDIQDLPSLRKAMPENVDVVFHLAASVGLLPPELEHTRFEVNQLGTRHVIDTCIEKKVGRMIQVSTTLAYDWRVDQPLTEKTPPNLWSKDEYIESKRRADEECKKGIEKGLDIVFVHPTAVIGAYDRATWSKLFREIDKGLLLPFAPPGRASLCHSKAVAKSLIAAAEKGISGGHYILGGPDVSWFELMVKVGQVMKKPGPKWVLPKIIFQIYGWCEFRFSTLLGREPALSPHTINLLAEPICCDDRKAQAELGYRSSTLDEMVMDCYNWMLAEGLLAKPK